jgi:hypothetical protein
MNSCIYRLICHEFKTQYVGQRNVGTSKKYYRSTRVAQ